MRYSVLPNPAPDEPRYPYIVWDARRNEIADWCASEEEAAASAAKENDAYQTYTKFQAAMKQPTTRSPK